MLVAAWQNETDPAAKLALVSALADMLSDTTDDAAVAALLQADSCTDAIRAEVARRTADRRRTAIAATEKQSTVPFVSAALERTALERTGVYVARILQQHLATDPGARSWTAEGTAAFVDISGFTKLSEQLARKGREGAEQIADAIGKSFEAVLEVAYSNGGSLLKFGGDSLLLWFASPDHVARACRAAVLMRRALRDAGRVRVPGAKATLRMSQGLHSGHFNFFAVGESHIELLPVGPSWSRLVAIENDAGADRILMSADTAALLPSRCVGEAVGTGNVLRREPPNCRESLPRVPRPTLPSDMLARALSPAIRDHVTSAGATPEHRPVTVAFIRFEETDRLIADAGPVTAADALHRLVSTVQHAAERRGVTFLASDVDVDGGKLILTAGAPKVSGEDEERMLLALRDIASADLPLPIRIGVHRGSVFAGDIGPVYRRTYTVMGDAVNLTARLMAAAGHGEIYATADVLERSNTLFAARQLAPLGVKGKARPVDAWSIGAVTGSRSRHASLEDYPLVGREREIALARDALESARAGRGRLIEVVGEAGIGKTRILESLRADAADMRQLHAVCEAYSASTPYSVFIELLREYMGFGRDDTEDVIEARLRDVVSAIAPDLVPWLPLVAIAFGLELAPTPEVALLAERNRRSKLHEVVGQFLGELMREPALVEIESVDHMDAASAELLTALLGTLHERPWLVAITRRGTGSGFSAPELPSVTQIALQALSFKDALRITELATEKRPLPLHMLRTVAERSGGNPQYLRDLLRAAVESGGVGGLPDSAETAAMARIDALTPQDRAVVRRAAVFGLTFHPRNLAWLADDECPEPTAGTWERLAQFFDEEGDGYVRFRRSLLRDAAYEGLPYKLRRRLHGVVAAQLEQELDDPDDASAILSLHYFVAGEYASAWRYATIGAKRAQEVYAYVEAAGLFSRALESAERVSTVTGSELCAVHESLGDSWNHAGEFKKASDAYGDARKLVENDALWKSRLLLKRSKMEEKLGKCAEARRWAARARKALVDATGRDVSRHAADVDAWYATVLQTEGRPHRALRWARRAVEEAEAVDDAEALGAAYFVLGWVHSDLGQGGAEPMWQRSLEAYRRAGNRERQAGLLANLGAACHWDGRWDEALSYYELGRQQSLAIGDLVDSELARINVAELLTDRGEWEQAEKILLESLPRWRALEYRYFLAACLSVLGRVALRSARYDDALLRLDEARALFEHTGAAQEVLDIDARIAECRLLRGEFETALALADATLARARNGKDVPKVAALLERVRGYAYARRGETEVARRSFEASLAAARARRDHFEITLATLAQIALDQAQGREPAAELVAERDALIERLRIARLSPLPPLGTAS